MPAPTSNETEFLRNLYRDFNARNIETVLAALHEGVMWANGMEGGHLHGRDAVRSYWTRQWPMLDPRVEPLAFSQTPDEAIRVEVHQIVRDLEGNVLRDAKVSHLFRIEDGLVRRFDILES
ncbi:MAG: nuclear transport factor 2 family protein [Acidobacteriaceae bacterium]